MTASPHRLALPPLLTGVLWLVVGCGAAVQAVEPVGEPTHYRGRGVAARGPTMARDGSTCSVEVQPADGAFLNCRIRVRCDGDLVYGLSGAGFNNCRRDGDLFVFAHDHSGTRRDGDPRMFFDLMAGRVIISDDDPDVEVLVDLMTSPEGYGGERTGGGERADDGPSGALDPPGGETPADEDEPAPDESEGSDEPTL